MSGKRIGEVTHFYNKISVAVIALTGKLRVGDTLHFLGRSTDFSQEVTSMQIEHQSVEEVGPGQEVAVRVESRVRRNDKVYKLEGDE